jgi:hypothetical protein
MRTIIDGTTDMRESPDWIVFLFQDGDDGFGQAAYRAFAEPIVLIGSHSRGNKGILAAQEMLDSAFRQNFDDIVPRI